MLASFTAGLEYPRGDVNYDGQVSIADATCLIDYLLNGYWPEDPVTPPDTHEYVDLGLPSGTLWATMNIGANAPGESGDYFAWGETEPKDYYDWTTYKWCNSTSSGVIKYCTNSSDGHNGFTDGKTELDPADDAAYVNWGHSWRMPTMEQIQELVENCSWQWTGRGQKGTGAGTSRSTAPAIGVSIGHARSILMIVLKPITWTFILTVYPGTCIELATAGFPSVLCASRTNSTFSLIAPEQDFRGH